MADDPKKDDTGTQGKTEASAPDVKALQDQIAALQKEKQEWMNSNQSLGDKVKKENEDKQKRDSDSKSLESALTFNLTSQQFIKDNESVLPKDFGDIFKAAEKEKYDSAIHKSNAIKASLIQSFFSLQANVDYLTESQKLTLADYLKLTKNGKEEKAREIYDNLFEPALGTLKRVKKAEEIYRTKQGFGSNTDSEAAYKNKLTEMAQKKFFGGKSK